MILLAMHDFSLMASCDLVWYDGCREGGRFGQQQMLTCALKKNSTCYKWNTIIMFIEYLFYISFPGCLSTFSSHQKSKFCGTVLTVLALVYFRHVSIRLKPAKCPTEAPFPNVPRSAYQHLSSRWLTSCTLLAIEELQHGMLGRSVGFATLGFRGARGSEKG